MFDQTFSHRLGCQEPGDEIWRIYLHCRESKAGRGCTAQHGPGIAGEPRQTRQQQTHYLPSALRIIRSRSNDPNYEVISLTSAVIVVEESRPERTAAYNKIDLFVNFNFTFPGGRRITEAGRLVCVAAVAGDFAMLRRPCSATGSLSKNYHDPEAGSKYPPTFLPFNPGTTHDHPLLPPLHRHRSVPVSVLLSAKETDHAIFSTFGKPCCLFFAPDFSLTFPVPLEYIAPTLTHSSPDRSSSHTSNTPAVPTCAHPNILPLPPLPPFTLLPSNMSLSPISTTSSGDDSQMSPHSIESHFTHDAQSLSPPDMSANSTTNGGSRSRGAMLGRGLACARCRKRKQVRKDDEIFRLWKFLTHH